MRQPIGALVFNSDAATRMGEALIDQSVPSWRNLLCLLTSGPKSDARSGPGVFYAERIGAPIHQCPDMSLAVSDHGEAPSRDALAYLYGV